jgi:hypothetical protein
MLLNGNVTKSSALCNTDLLFLGFMELSYPIFDEVSCISYHCLRYIKNNNTRHDQHDGKNFLFCYALFQQ